VLRRDDDGVDAVRGSVGVVLDGDLALGVGPHERKLARAAHRRVPLHQPVRKINGQRHQRLGLVAGEAEHHALVARPADVHALGDVRRLRVQPALHLAGVGGEADRRIDVADLADRVADDAVNGLA